jgi:hypothetical protein
MEMGNGPTKKKRTNTLRKSLGHIADPSMIELNVGGKVSGLIKDLNVDLRSY